MLSDAIGIPVDCPSTAGEGGAWGIAVLAAYRAHVLAGGTMPLVDFIETIVRPAVDKIVRRTISADGCGIMSAKLKKGKPS